MKKLGLILMFSLYVVGHAQLTRGFNYQAVAREADGTPKTGAVNIRFVIHQNTANGAAVLDETHNGLALNAFGLFSTAIGSVNTAAFNDIDWANGPYFLEVRVDGQQLGPITQFQAVPYSKMATDMNLGDLKNVIANNPGNGQVLKWNGNEWRPADDAVGNGGGGTEYTAGDGIEIAGTEIRNTKPDQEVSLQGTGGTTVTGNYPNFTINSEQGGPGTVYTAGDGIRITNDNEIINSNPDKIVSIDGQGTINVGGNYPNFTINSTDPDEDKTNEFQDLVLQGNTLSITDGNSVELPTATTGNTPWTKTGKDIYYDEGEVGIGVKNPGWTLHVIHPGGDAKFGIGMENGGAIVKNEWHIHIADGRFDTHMVFRRNNRDKIKFTDDGTVIEVSDERLKTEVAALSSALPRILQLRPTTYTMNNEGASSKPVLGLMAQEVHRLFPEITDYHPGDDQYGIAYSRIGVLAIQAIKEQQDIIHRQQEEMKTLKDNLAAQQQLIQEMNARLKQIETSQLGTSSR